MGRPFPDNIFGMVYALKTIYQINRFTFTRYKHFILNEINRFTCKIISAASGTFPARRPWGGPIVLAGGPLYARRTCGKPARPVP
jgi:hypothetical protein